MMGPFDTNRATRRHFIAGAAGLAAAGSASARADNVKNLPPNVADWTRQLGQAVGVRGYGNPSKYEKDVVRRTVPWLTATPESSVSFTPLHQLDGIVTPNGLCFERHHGGIAEIDPNDYRLMLHGLVDKPLIFTLDELKRLPRINKIYFLECAANSGMEWRGAQLNGCQYTHGMVHCVQYTGVPLKLLLEQAGLKPNAKWIMVEGGDAAAMNRSIPLNKALDDCMVAYRMNGEMLRPEQGYPVRLVVPGWEGNVWVKWLRRIKVGDQPWFTREETSKYTDLLESGKARKFTFVMEIRHHLAIAADAGEAKRVQRYFGTSLVRTRQNQARRYFTRWWPKLAYGTGRWARFGQGVRPFLLRFRLERRRAFAAVARHGRDRLRSAEQGRPAQDSRRQFDLPQQRNTDMGAETRRRGRECRSRVEFCSSPRC